MVQHTCGIDYYMGRIKGSPVSKNIGPRKYILIGPDNGLKKLDHSEAFWEKTGRLKTGLDRPVMGRRQ